ncbi:MAG: O-methyltransferase [Caulobacterales bacterium]
MAHVTGDAKLEALLERLHAQSDCQVEATSEFFRRRAAAGELSWDGMDERSHRFMSDKLVALDREKAEFCYLLCRTLGARRVVEAGTSYGVSTLYLAAAVRDNCRDGAPGVVIGTEHEPAKAAAARENFAAAGLAEFVDLREGDLRETLKDTGGPVDFMLLDIWVEMARPALELVAPRLRPGAIVVADNTAAVREPYRAYFEFLSDPANGFRTMTLPFEGGLELSVRTG